jgi:7-carboxy-7-deazaguanine synthase
MTHLDDAQNQELVQEMRSAKKIPVIEIFGPTIQGEGPLAGSKTMFVRTGGCDYRCQKCDSLHAVIPQAVKAHAERLTEEEIFFRLESSIRRTGTKWVTLSGGNPCMWDLGYLQQTIQEGGGSTSVETQGTLCPDWLLRTNMVVVSPKSPGMGERFELDKFKAFLEKLKGRALMALKVVVFSQQDIDFALEVGEIALEMEAIPKGMRFMSLGNMHPPKLTESLELYETVPRQHHMEALLRAYRIGIEDMTNDRRVDDWKFLPQLHILAFGNEMGR